MDQTQIALGVLTIAASGVVSGVVTFKLNSRRDARRMRREKLEQLFLAHSAFARQLGAGWLPYISVMQGAISYNDALDMVRKPPGDDRPYDKMEMLVAIYFPELGKELKKLLQIRDRSAESIARHKEVYKSRGPHRTPERDVLLNIMSDLDVHESEFRRQMVRVAHSLGAPSKHAA